MFPLKRKREIETDSGNTSEFPRTGKQNGKVLLAQRYLTLLGVSVIIQPRRWVPCPPVCPSCGDTCETTQRADKEVGRRKPKAKAETSKRLAASRISEKMRILKK